MLRNLIWLSTTSLAVLVIAITFNGSAASNSVASVGLDIHTEEIGPNELAPEQCSTLVLTNLIVGSGTINGTANADLILGSSSADTISANEDGDCIVAGGGDDDLDGGDGFDVCLTGAGIDTTNACETIQ